MIVFRPEKKTLAEIAVFGVKNLDVDSQKQRCWEDTVAKALLMMSACILLAEEFQVA